VEPTLRVMPLLEAPGQAQMRLDDELLDRASRGEAWARIGVWKPPAVSLGYSQPEEPPLTRERLAERGLDLVRRQTGGLAVVHDPATATVHLALPPSHPYTSLPVEEAAFLVAAWISLALTSLGLPARPSGIRPREPQVPHETRLCLAYASSGDILAADGRKAGSVALRLTPKGLLAQAILILGAPDIELYAWVDEYPEPEHLETVIGGLGSGDPEDTAKELPTALAATRLPDPVGGIGG